MEVLFNNADITCTFKDVEIGGLFMLKSNRKIYLKVAESYVVDMREQEVCCDMIAHDEKCIGVKSATLSITI